MSYRLSEIYLLLMLMNKRQIILNTISIAFLAMIISSSVIGSKENTLVIQGSNTVFPIANLAAARFQECNPGITVTVGGEGSGAGIADLIDGKADVATASRFPKQSEIDEANNTDVELIVHTIAKDGIAIIVNPNNPLSELSFEQISKIYNGTYTHWSNLSLTVAVDPIRVLERDESSGTHDYFNEEFLNGEEVNPNTVSDYAQYQSTSQLFADVAENVNAIGYGGLAYVDETVKAVAVKKEEGDTAVTPTIATVSDASYPISRPLYMITNGEPEEGDLRKYWLDFILSVEGQSIVLYVGYIPIGNYLENYDPTNPPECKVIVEGTPFGFITVPIGIAIFALALRRRD